MVDKVAKKILVFSLKWDSGEITDDEWESLRLKESKELALEILKTVQSLPTKENV